MGRRLTRGHRRPVARAAMRAARATRLSQKNKIFPLATEPVVTERSKGAHNSNDASAQPPAPSSLMQSPDPEALGRTRVPPS